MMVIRWPKHVRVWLLNILHIFSDRHWTNVWIKIVHLLEPIKTYFSCNFDLHYSKSVIIMMVIIIIIIIIISIISIIIIIIMHANDLPLKHEFYLR
jgi:hypothetical protein